MTNLATYVMVVLAVFVGEHTYVDRPHLLATLTTVDAERQRTRFRQALVVGGRGGLVGVRVGHGVVQALIEG